MLLFEILMRDSLVTAMYYINKNLKVGYLGIAIFYYLFCCDRARTFFGKFWILVSVIGGHSA